jgi:hypothetical protein
MRQFRLCHDELPGSLMLRSLPIAIMPVGFVKPYPDGVTLRNGRIPSTPKGINLVGNGITMSKMCQGKNSTFDRSDFDFNLGPV